MISHFGKIYVDIVLPLCDLIGLSSFIVKLCCLFHCSINTGRKTNGTRQQIVYPWKIYQFNFKKETRKKWFSTLKEGPRHGEFTTLEKLKT